VFSCEYQTLKLKIRISDQKLQVVNVKFVAVFTENILHYWNNRCAENGVSV